jgi:hypothetical protein
MEWNLSMSLYSLFRKILSAESDTLLPYNSHWLAPTLTGTHVIYNTPRRSPLQDLVHHTPQSFAHNHGLLRLACHGPRKSGGA